MISRLFSALQAAFALPGLAVAQYDLGKHFDLEATATDSADLSAQDAEISWYRAGFDYNRPLQDVPYDPAREWGVFWGLEGDFTMVDFSGDGLFGFEDYDLWRVRLPIQVLYRPGGEAGSWVFGGMIAPGLASDLDGGLSFDAVTVNALLTAVYQFNDQFEAGVGVYYSTDFGAPLALPGVGFRWMPDEDFTLAVFPPIASANWQATDLWGFELYVRPSGGFWHLEDSAVEDAEDFSLSSWLAGVEIERQFGAGALTLGGGITFNNRVELTDDDGDKVIGSNVDSAAFARVGYRFEW